MKKARMVIKKYKSFLKKMKKNQQIKSKLERFDFCHALTEVLLQVELAKNRRTKGRRRLDKRDFIKVLAFIDQLTDATGQIPSGMTIQTITGNCLDHLSYSGSLDNLTYNNQK